MYPYWSIAGFYKNQSYALNAKNSCLYAQMKSMNAVIAIDAQITAEVVLVSVTN